MKRILIDMKTYSSGKSCTVASWVEARRSGTEKLEQSFGCTICLWEKRQTLNVAKDGIADIPQSLYEAMRNGESAWNVVHYLQSGFSGGLETWLPILQGIADKGFSGHPPCLC